MNEPKEKRTDPRVLRTRQLLKNALVELLQEMSLEKITVNKIAERATINRVTFYLHYRDIPDMLEKMAEEMVVDVERAMDRKRKEQPWNSSDGILLELLEHIASNAEFYKVIIGSRRVPIFHERLRDVFTRKISEGMTDKGLNNSGIQQDVALWFGSAALLGTIASWLRSDLPYSPQFLARQFVLLLRPDDIRQDR